ncbi:MAG: polyribonucleotide nucleotidyltransferase, partial [Clostridia bacterium]|nr:polyribonucleotide nucleotidyltransferase [Clostridia bacterium]
MDKRVFQTEVAGRPLVIETGELARQANGSALVSYGDTTVLVTATATPEPRQDADFLPLRVDFEERQYAAGRIPGSFFRREGRPSERAILCARLIDRPLRPLFPAGFHHDVQVVATVLSFDGSNLPELCGLIGASFALSVSDIPFGGPMAGVMVGLLDGRLVLNPTAEQMARSDLELTVAGTRDAILMVEAGANEVPEEQILDALLFAHEEIRRLVAWQEEAVAQVGRPKMVVTVEEPPEELERAVRAEATGPIREALLVAEKQSREAALRAARERLTASLLERFPGQEKHVARLLGVIEKEVMRRAILEEGRRPDGRGPRDIRPISCRVGLLPRTHGSGLFTRGQTQVLTVAALGAIGDRQELDAIGEIEEFKRYMHHYNMPPYSTGEVRPIRAPGRREIGHGHLAERALARMIPPQEEFPYTIRLVSEVLESNGSTSMASVCGSTLALMDAGVPIRAPVAGIAMGLIKEGDRVEILSDIQGIEDHLGDMDFKVAGTARGVTAMQMDIKIAGVDRDILARALDQARAGRLFILEKMLEVLPQPRPDLSPYAPRILVIQIQPERIRDVIGPGGKVINRIQQETGVKIDIEDDGKVFIAGELEGGQRALKMIRELTRDVEKGEVFLGKVVRITSFGAFVELFPGRDGLVHISQLANERIPRVEDVVQVGDQIMVKVIEIDELGRINLSRREALRTVPDAELREVRQAARAGGGSAVEAAGRTTRGGQPNGAPRRGWLPREGG